MQVVTVQHNNLLTADAEIVKLKKILQLLSVGSDLNFNIALRGLNDSLTAIIKTCEDPDSCLLM